VPHKHPLAIALYIAAALTVAGYARDVVIGGLAPHSPWGRALRQSF
jgi:hypothetical protein